MLINTLPSTAVVVNENIVTVHRGQPVTTSLQVAGVFQKRHDRVLESIRNILPDLPKNSAPFFREATYLDDQQKPRPMYEMDRDGFTLVAMSFTGKPALQFKLTFIEAFNKMEAALLRRKDPESIEARATGKIVRRAETDAIKDFIRYAEAHGSQHARHYYTNFTNLVNKALSLKADGPYPVRDFLPPIIAVRLAVVEDAIAETIRQGIAAGVYYKEIFHAVKGRVLQLASALSPAVRRIASQGA